VRVAWLPKTHGQDRRQRDRIRGTRQQRGYDDDWYADDGPRMEALIRDRFTCQIRTHCNGAWTNEVDHIIPIEERPDLRLDLSNLQSACKPCHSAKTMRESVNPLR
jgi:5-methylcytosine-specific restriction protein A